MFGIWRSRLAGFFLILAICPPFGLQGSYLGFSGWKVLWLAAVAVLTSSRLDPYWLPWLLWCALCAVKASRPEIAFRGLHWTYENGVAQTLILWVLWGSDWPEKKAWMKAALITACLFTFGQAMLNGRVPGTMFDEPNSGRMYGSFGSPVLLGSFLALGVVGTSSLVRVLCFGALLLTKARSSIIAVVAGGVFLYWHRRPRPGVVAILAGIIIVAAGFSFSGRGIVRSDAGRRILWDVCLKAVRARPLMGWGPENTMYAVEATKDKAEWDKVYSTTTQDHAHNNVLEALVTTGIPGVILFSLLSWYCWNMVEGREGQAVLLTLFVAGLFNPVSFAAKACAMILVAPRHPYKRPWASLVAVISVVSMLWCWRQASNIADEGLPLVMRQDAGLVIGYLNPADQK